MNILASDYTSYNNVVCDVTLSVHPHRASLKNMPGRGGNRTYTTFGILAECSAN